MAYPLAAGAMRLAAWPLFRRPDETRPIFLTATLEIIFEEEKNNLLFGTNFATAKHHRLLLPTINGNL
ncbi:snRNA-activating protein complex subunit [Trichinella spiralis]|uniref:snRNA-activating protein complex subunit n=1 Tax=Trichinella spiralis TaxID=6334 RepID=A0ABR3L0Z0_TRISP